MTKGTVPKLNELILKYIMLLKIQLCLLSFGVISKATQKLKMMKWLKKDENLKNNKEA